MYLIFTHISVNLYALMEPPSESGLQAQEESLHSWCTCQNVSVLITKIFEGRAKGCELRMGPQKAETRRYVFFRDFGSLTHSCTHASYMGVFPHGINLLGCIGDSFILRSMGSSSRFGPGRL
jgi:hypothetical protein